MDQIRQTALHMAIEAAQGCGEPASVTVDRARAFEKYLGGMAPEPVVIRPVPMPRETKDVG